MWNGRRWLRRVVLVLGVTGMSAVPLAAQLGYSGSIQVASGRYIFADRATSFSLSNGLEVQAGRFFGSVSLPLVLHNSKAISWMAGSTVPTGGPEHRNVREARGGRSGGPGGRSTLIPAGFDTAADSADIVDVTPPGDFQFHAGDPYLTAGVEVHQGTGLLRSVSLQGSAKAPLAGLDTGVGTGEWDFGIGGAVLFGTGNTLLFADAAWWKLGDLPALDLADPLQLGLAIGRSIGEGRWSLLASWSGSTRIIDGVDPEHSLGLTCYFIPSPGRSLSAGITAGLTESGSDFSAFAAWSLPL